MGAKQHRKICDSNGQFNIFLTYNFLGRVYPHDGDVVNLAVENIHYVIIWQLHLMSNHLRKTIKPKKRMKNGWNQTVKQRGKNSDNCQIKNTDNQTMQICAINIVRDLNSIKILSERKERTVCKISLELLKNLWNSLNKKNIMNKQSYKMETPGEISLNNFIAK